MAAHRHRPLSPLIFFRINMPRTLLRVTMIPTGTITSSNNNNNTIRRRRSRIRLRPLLLRLLPLQTRVAAAEEEEEEVAVVILRLRLLRWGSRRYSRLEEDSAASTITTLRMCRCLITLNNPRTDTGTGTGTEM